MTTLRIAARILGRIISFGLGGAFVCALIGALEGGVFGVLLGLLLRAHALPIGAIGVENYIGFGASIGALFGIWAGVISGALSFAILGGLQRAQSDLNAAFSGASCGAFWCALFGATGAAISGAVLWALLQMLHISIGLEPGGAPLQAALRPSGGGFFCGSVAGFVLGCFGGALHGGLTLKPITPRGLMRRLRPTHPDNPRADAEPLSV